MKTIPYLLTFLALGTCTHHQQYKTKESKLLFQENTTYNFGVINHMTKIEHQFLFKNNTTREIIINDVKVGCNCISTEATKRVIIPNDTFHVLIKLDLGKIDGRFDKTVMVTINNGEYYLMPRVMGFSQK